MVEFGKGPTLAEACSWLRDPELRRKRILDVAERNSVIEGLPPFREETRERILKQLEAMAAPRPEPVE